MSIGLYIVLAPLYLKSVRKLQEKRFVFVKILAIIIPENGAKVSKIKCFQFAQQTLITLEGYIASFEITPASTDDREGLRDLADHWSNVTILADKGYVGKNMKQEMQEKNICLFALKRSNSKENWPKSVRQLIFKLRRRVETVFSQLSGQLNAERVLAKSFQGLCTRLVNKVLAYNLCIALNSIFGETCEIGKIKKLIF